MELAALVIAGLAVSIAMSVLIMPETRIDDRGWSRPSFLAWPDVNQTSHSRRRASEIPSATLSADLRRYDESQF
jgi:hypothetical protein